MLPNVVSRQAGRFIPCCETYEKFWDSPNLDSKCLTHVFLKRKDDFYSRVLGVSRVTIGQLRSATKRGEKGDFIDNFLRRFPALKL